LGLIHEYFIISTWHQRRQDHRRYWRSQRRDSRVCHGPGRLESNTNTDLNAYSYVNANSDTCVHSYNNTYVYAYSYANGNCDGYSNCNPYFHSYTYVHSYSYSYGDSYGYAYVHTKTFADAEV
jgi:hypothetical protein